MSSCTMLDRMAQYLEGYPQGLPFQPNYFAYPLQSSSSTGMLLHCGESDALSDLTWSIQCGLVRL